MAAKWVVQSVVEELLGSDEPTVRLRTRLEVLGEPAESKRIKALGEEVRRSERVRMLLSERRNGVPGCHPYAKWYGAHWVLATLADLRYPEGDRSIVPLREQVYAWLFSKGHMEYSAKHETYSGPYASVRGLVRAHASMEGNAVYYLHALGLADDRTEALADRLVEWQWPDGGWNCDKTPKAHTSSFTESLLPLRGLALHSRERGGPYRESVRRAAEYFLERRLFRRKTDGRVISQNFTRLHYPCYWHYDFLFGLKVMKEAGYINDERCAEALSLLESKKLRDGGFPAEKSYYRVAKSSMSGRSLVGWGGVSLRKMNEFVTVDALSVLAASRRSSLSGGNTRKRPK